MVTGGVWRRERVEPLSALGRGRPRSRALATAWARRRWSRRRRQNGWRLWPQPGHTKGDLPPPPFGCSPIPPPLPKMHAEVDRSPLGLSWEKKPGRTRQGSGPLWGDRRARRQRLGSGTAKAGAVGGGAGHTRPPWRRAQRRGRARASSAAAHEVGGWVTTHPPRQQSIPLSPRRPFLSLHAGARVGG